MNLFGRAPIYTDVEEINAENLIDVLTKAFETHDENARQIKELYNIYKGDQQVFSRKKTIRDDIKNMVCENRAKQIVDFKVGYLFGDPVQYISSRADDLKTDEISLLNTWMREEELEAKNVELDEWRQICVVAYKMVLQKDDPSSSPFEIFIPAPAQTFVIYSSGLGHKPMAGVYYVVDSEGTQHINVYTPTSYYKLLGMSSISEICVNGLGEIPIVEYPANNARLGAFEPVVTLLDALNELDSNRIDGVEQFIQSLVIAINCEFEEGQTFADIVKSGIVSLKSSDGMNQDLKILTEQLNQSQTQTLKDDIISAIIQITAMPNRNGGYSTSDTGLAVVYRDGWSAAESDAKKSEMPFKRAERQLLNIVLKICNTLGGLDLSQSDIDIHFDRRNFENIEMKANVLTQLLSNDKLAPRLAFVMSNMFPDAESAYQESIPFIENAAKADSNNQREL